MTTSASTRDQEIAAAQEMLTKVRARIAVITAAPHEQKPAQILPAPFFWWDLRFWDDVVAGFYEAIFFPPPQPRNRGQPLF